MTELKT